MIKVSVVIPTYNRQEQLNDCLFSLAEQTYRNFEVIIVDDGSNESFEKIPVWNDFGIKITYLRQKNQGAAAARNKGVKAAKGEIIAFIDDDCLADKDWLKNGIRHFKNKSVVAVVGKVDRDGKESTPTSSVTYTFDAKGFMTANVFYRKSAFEKVGGFDERFNGFREDTDLGWRIEELGKVVNDASCVVTHKTIDYSVLGFFMKHIRTKETYNDVLFYKKHPEKFRKSGELFHGIISTHLLWPFMLLCLIIGTSFADKIFNTNLFLYALLIGYVGIVYFHTKMRSSAKPWHFIKHPFKSLGLVLIWWIIMTHDIADRLVATIEHRKILF